MSKNFKIPTYGRFNLNPPSDDGASSTNNLGKFGTILNKLSLPLLSLFNDTNGSLNIAFSAIENRGVSFTSISTPAEAAAFNFGSSTTKALIILIGAPGSGFAGTVSDAGNGGGAGGTVLLLENDVQNAVPVFGTGVALYINSTTGMSASANGGGDATALAVGAGGNATLTQGTSQSTAMLFKGQDGRPFVGTVPGRGGPSFFGSGGIGTGGNGGEVNTAAPAFTDSSFTWIWEIE